MTTFRLISLSTHGAVELLLGLAVMVAPFALGLSSAALVLGVLAGALLSGVALGTVDPSRGSISAHHANDVGLSIGLIVAGVALGLAGDPRAAIVFAGAALLHTALVLTTRYSAAR